MAFLLEPDGANGGELWIKAPGDRTPGPNDLVLTAAAPSTGSDPDYRWSELFGDPVFNGVEIDAISSGNGFIPGLSAAQNEEGVPLLNGSWLGVNITVQNGTGGNQGVTYLDRAENFYTSGLGGASGEIISYYLDASVGIHPLIAGETMLEQTRTHVGLGRNTTSDISGFDFGIGLIHHNHDLVSQSPFFSVTDRVYFSVTRDWAQQNSSLPFATALDSSGIPGGVTPHGTDVYYMRWEGSGSGANVTWAWEGPFLWIAGDDLGLNRVHGELNALEINAETNSIVFSPELNSTVNGTVTTEQLWILELEGTEREAERDPANGNPTPLRDVVEISGATATKKVTDQLGSSRAGNPVGPREVNGVCIVDPYATIVDPFVATSKASHAIAGGDDPMGLSAYRGMGGPNQTVWRIQVTGWGTAVPQPGYLTLFQRIGTVDSTGHIFPNNGWLPVGAHLRSATEHAVEFTVPHRLLVPDSPATIGTTYYESFYAMQFDRVRQPIMSSWLGHYQVN